MTHRGGLSLSIIIWRIGGEGPSFLLPSGPTILLAALVHGVTFPKLYQTPCMLRYKENDNLWTYSDEFYWILIYILFSILLSIKSLVEN